LILAGDSLARPMLFFRFVGPSGGGGFVDDAVSSARLATTKGRTVDASGNVYAADRSTPDRPLRNALTLLA
jgi:hypothetical protein